MKTLRRTGRIFASAVVALPLAASAAVIHTFDTEGDLAEYFNATGNAAVFVEAANGGIDNTRAAVATTSGAGQGARVEKLGFAGNTSEFTLSFLFKPRTPTMTGGIPWSLGILPTNTSSVNNATSGNPNHHQMLFGLLYTGNSSEGELNVFSLRYYNGSAGTVTGATDSAFKWSPTAGEWYQLRADFSVNPSDRYDVTYGIYNAAADGTVGSVIRSVTVNNLNNPALLSDPEVHAFFFSTSSTRQRGTDHIDNFASPVPEPGTLLLAGFGLGALRLLRRRRA